MFIEFIGMGIYGFWGMLLSTLGIFAIGFAEGEDGDDDEITFKNQEALNDMVEKRLAKQKKALLDDQEAQFKKMKDELENSVEELKDDLKEAKAAKAEKTTDDPKLKDLTENLRNVEKEMKKLSKERDEAVADAEKIKSSTQENKIQMKVISLLTEKKVVAPNDIYLILKESKNIVLDESGEIIPVYANTDNQVVGQAGKLMDLNEFLDGWLKERPHFVSASDRKGSGTMPANTSISEKKAGGDNNEEKPMTMTEILSSKEHKEIEADLIQTGDLQHGGQDIE